MGKKDYHNWPKERLVHEIKQLLKRKKFGLVWEDKPEEVAEKCKEFLPVLKEDKTKQIMTDKNGPVNILIEGDNYHSLSVLNYTHKRKIDVIYIDPPFNTGARDWKYNNNYVDTNDAWRHSKWLSFMNNRLKLAKNLLKPDGVLICAIDENEQASLGLLLEEIFHKHKRDCITIVHNPRGVQGKNFSYCHEYAYFIYPNDGKEYIGDVEREIYLVEELRDHGGDSLRTDAKNCFYPIICNKEKIVEIGDVPNDNFHPSGKNTKRKDGLIEIWPIDKNGIERKWTFAKNSIYKIIGKLQVKKNTNGLVDVFREKTEQKPRTVWIGRKYDASTWGSKIVKQITNKDFPYPKSLYTVKDCISILVKNNPNAIILDYFAGSGTTAHAVSELNKRDGGARQFILCTNNEDNNGDGARIATDICYPRIKNVIEGYSHKGKKVAGLGGNLRYYQTDFVEQVRTDNDKRVLVSRSTEMLCLAENTFEEVLSEKGLFALYQNSKRITGIIYDEDAIADFRKAIKKFKKPLVVYVFSYDHTYNEEDFADITNLIKVKPIGLPPFYVPVVMRVSCTYSPCLEEGGA